MVEMTVQGLPGNQHHARMCGDGSLTEGSFCGRGVEHPDARYKAL